MAELHWWRILRPSCVYSGWPRCKGSIKYCHAGPLCTVEAGVCACLLEIGDGGKERHAAKGSCVQIGPHHLWVSVLRCGFRWRSESQKMSGGLVAG